MLSRRSFLAAGAVPLLPLAGLAPARAGSGPCFRFGIVADPQYAPVPPEGTRHYADSLRKLSEAIAAFNAEDLAFVATLGDIIDRGRESYADILPLYRQLAAPHHFVLGNHDGAAAADYLDLVEEVTGRRRGYYDHAVGGYRFLVIDGNEVSTFAHAPGTEAHGLAVERLARMKAAGAVNTSPVSGGLSEAQFAWIEATMQAARAAGERVIVQGHYPVYPKAGDNLWDDDRLVDLLTAYDNFTVYMNGHNHDGNYARIDNRHFLNFKGMVETPDTTAYAVVEVWDDRIEVLGRGREPSRTLGLDGALASGA
jgi:predicted phosphodiesterase